ncbi:MULTISPECIES: TolC family protein [unclassified Mesorhizobium]|uniref:TolC family protein n=1 Tax=unclassified Mesorhizobium TaxID=325217 RepID=UPI001201D12F|nr:MULTISPECIES: TolC family protein [unclassified Mesorhizobium]TIS16013.1 MAG: hypothetical protein E5X10_08970 [Mesorhizobium sp.]
MANRQRSLAFVRDSQAAGNSSDLQIVQGEQLVAKAAASIPNLEVQLGSSIDELASLTGQSVADLKITLRKGKAQPIPRYKIGVGIPADVIRNRSDIQTAESNFAAAAENVGVAQAAFYPSLDLSGYLTPTQVIDSGHVNVWLIAANFTAPIFDAGKNKANLADAKAKLEEARAAWSSAALSAIAEVEKSLAAYNKDDQNVAAQQKLVSTSRRMIELGQTSFKLGAGPIFNVLDSQRDYLEAQESLAEAVRSQAEHYISLCKAAPAAK